MVWLLDDAAKTKICVSYKPQNQPIFAFRRCKYEYRPNTGATHYVTIARACVRLTLHAYFVCPEKDNSCTMINPAFISAL